MSFSEQLKDVMLKVFENTQQSIDTFKAKNTPENIEEEVHNTLQEGKQQILRKLLGFDKDTWGKKEWYFDHCNGRAGNSPAGIYIAEVQQKAVHAWLASADIESIGMTEKMKKSMLERYEYIYKSKYQDLLEAHARNAASEAFTKLDVDDLMSAIDKMQDLLEDSKDVQSTQ